MVNLPEELLLDILSRLPVESLVRFKAVCRSWYALLESQKFVYKHMANQSNDHVVLMRTAEVNFISLLSNNGQYDDDVSCIVDLDLGLKCPSHEDRICSLLMHGYCDGIVALSCAGEDIILCNPAIREVRILPRSNSFLRYTSGQNPLDSGTIGIGLGYDPKTKDYKVIRIMAFWTDESHNFELPHRAEVFSLYANSTWREIEGTVGAKVCVNEDLEQYFDGFHYWIGTDDNTKNHVVISFDMADEVFQKAPIPDDCDNLKNLYWSLGVLKNETIALFVWPKQGFEQGIEKFIDVWVMKKFGLKESWTKQLSIGPLLGLIRPLVFWKNDKEILQEDIDGDLASYDLATRDSKKLSIHQNIGVLQCWEGYLYKKTLVSVNTKEGITI